MKRSNFDTWNQDLPVCPHCGDTENDVFTIEERGDNLQCSSCGKDYHVEVNTSVTYTTSFIEKPKKEVGGRS
jgi:transcription elongation factor Elf1